MRHDQPPVKNAYEKIHKFERMASGVRVGLVGLYFSHSWKYFLHGGRSLGLRQLVWLEMFMDIKGSGFCMFCLSSQAMVLARTIPFVSRRIKQCSTSRLVFMNMIIGTLHVTHKVLDMS